MYHDPAFTAEVIFTVLAALAFGLLLSMAVRDWFAARRKRRERLAARVPYRVHVPRQRDAEV